MKHFKAMHRFAAVMTAAVLMSESASAFAQGVNFTDVTKNITQSTSTLPNLISTVAYIGGVGMGVAGIFKLKQHVDNPSQTPMKDGLVRLGSGGGLLVLPYMTEAMMGTVSGGNQATGPNAQQLQFQAATFN
jgi:hypothetical protein